ncbi:MAG: tyrosine-type recombinase/integrase [Verrucomicrobia bacterium]|nr:tyrosine-type recombinase/integrase [Verrucomicrobiota bacterium]MBU4292001.1 tyrosine-type recombinase/integrase [Verrucomicrobiota bacterium]MBU4427889.1 tyrosine-type recombinase/integrase [Verrucomicrobiota bacterium]MCG2678835.1 tyrosine-type recombinase/integrase [Kiritimatiellia bacterium]
MVDDGFHSLRHTWVSLPAATPQAVIQDSVGHANPAMTAHYTHVSEATARDVVLALPAFTASSSKALPPAKSTKMIEAAPVKALGEKLNGKNWKKIRADIIAMATG